MAKKIYDSRNAELDFDQPFPATNSSVLDFICSKPTATTETDLFRHFQSKGSKRRFIKSILKYLENNGMIRAIDSKTYISNVNLPKESEVVIIEVSNNHIAGRAVGRNGVFGPRIRVLKPKLNSDSAAPTELNVDDRVRCKIRKVRNQWEATIMRNLNRTDKQTLVGQFSVVDSTGNGIVNSAKSSYHNPIFVPKSRTNGAKHGDIVQITYDIAGKFRNEHVTRLKVIGKQDDLDLSYTLAVYENDLPTEFPNEVVEQLKTLSPVDVARHDFTHKKLITIDPEDAKDHDDAVYAERNENGWTIIVAIADVSAYVPYNSEIDLEARLRGNSTYFPNRVIPMLPFELSAGLCSLKPNEERLCLLVEMKFDERGRKQSHKFYRAKMKSAGNLSYEDVQNAIDGKPCSDLAKSLLKPVLKPLWGAYRALQQALRHRKPLLISSVEAQIEIDNNGAVTNVKTKETLEAHKLVEEFMIQANVSAAESLAKCDSPVLYRVHDKPKYNKVERFKSCVEGQGIEFERTPSIRKPEFFNELIQRTEDTSYSVALQEAILRCQSQAIYSPNNNGHFGLNLKQYVHFTSPIRRYSDLVIHRSLIRELQLGDDETPDVDLQKFNLLAQHLCQSERRSMAAERSAVDRFLASYYKDKEQSQHEGYITGVNERRLFVRFSETTATGSISIFKLRNFYWEFNAQNLSIENKRKAKVYKFGQKVDVEIFKVDTLTGQIELKMLSPPLDLEQVATEKNSRDQNRKKKRSRRRKRREKENS